MPIKRLLKLLQNGVIWVASAGQCRLDVRVLSVQQPYRAVQEAGLPVTDPHGNRCDRMVRVHIRELARPPYDLFQHVSCAQRIYGRYGVYFCVASMASINVTAEVHTRLARVVMGAGQASSEWADLYRRHGVQEISAITAFVVQRLIRGRSSIYGTASHRPDIPSVVVSADSSDWVLAHEVGHVLIAGRGTDPHSKGPGELMREGRDHVSTEINPTFNEQQVAWIRQSPYSLPC